MLKASVARASLCPFGLVRSSIFRVCGLGLEAGNLRNNRSGVLLRLAESEAEGKGAARSISLPHSEWIDPVLSLLLVVV
jgi:hypothetical protein